MNNLAGILTIIFVVLKLAEVGIVATWSWWWVFSPLLIAWGIGLTICAIIWLALALKN